MKIHEYQAKQVLRKYGIPIPDGQVVETAEEALLAAKKLGCPVVVKSQIHAGGRGKGKVYGGRGSVGAAPRLSAEALAKEDGRPAGEGNHRGLPLLDGGVKLAKTPEEARDIAGKILGNILVTHQTGPEGKTVKKVFIEKACAIARELYLGATLDRSTSRVTFMASAEGGMDIEIVAAKHPEKIFKMGVDPASGVNVDEARVIAEKLGLGVGTAPRLSAEALAKEDGRPKDEGNHMGLPLLNQFISLIQSLYKAYVEADCSLVEINPLVVTKEGNLLAVDAKVNFDDNALFRHPDFEALRDLNEEDPAEIEAKKHDLSYISLDGTIGCMVNGAGLAMATMDIIKLNGGEPANFLDVGGGATAEKVTEAFKIILADPKVKAILVNIFGGIMRCDVIANGIVSAAREVHIKMPVVIRLQGTNVDLGKKILQESGLSLISEDDLSKAAAKVVSVIK